MLSIKKRKEVSMKGNRYFVISMLILFVLMFALQLQLPKDFVWDSTYSHLDRQPFGCYVFDSVMNQSLPQGYHVTKQSFSQLDRLGKIKNKNMSVLVVVDVHEVSPTEIQHMLNIAKRGGKVMIVSSGGLICGKDSLLREEFEFSKVNFYEINFFDLGYLRTAIQKADSTLYDSIIWRQHDSAYSPRRFKMYENILTSTLTVDSIPHSVLAYHLDPTKYVPKEDSLYVGKHWSDTVWIDKECRKYKLVDIALRKKPVAVSVPCGKGELYYVSTPLLFTNYGVLDQEICPYVFRLMSQIADLPVYRTEVYLETKAMQDAYYSPMRELVKRPPLRWALYLSMLGIVLYLLFSAKRRQRIIPVMTKPDNKSLEFVKLIGTLYYQRHDNTDLVKKKFRFFAEEVRRKVGLDISDVNHGDDDIILLAEKTGLDSQTLGETIRQIRWVLHYDGNIPMAQMRQLIDEMNKILERL